MIYILIFVPIFQQHKIILTKTYLTLQSKHKKTFEQIKRPIQHMFVRYYCYIISFIHCWANTIISLYSLVKLFCCICDNINTWWLKHTFSHLQNWRCIGMAIYALQELSKVLRYRKFSLETKKCVLNCNAMSVLFYGRECWAIDSL